jgi:nitrite reductase/ring-hydroxylating ferredoxin subunit
MTTQHFVLAANVNDLRHRGCLTAQVGGHTLALFNYNDRVYAVDNRCPHMGFPLHQGSVKDGILTCHWHHARFDLASGGAFDLWADDVRAFPTELRGNEIWVDVSAHGDAQAQLQQRLCDGLERNLPLVIAKSVIGLLPSSSGGGVGGEGENMALTPFRTGLDFGTRYRQNGWGQGLTILTCMMNLLPHLAPEDRSRALYHGLSAVANDTEGMAPRFMVQPLPNASTDIATLKHWLRQFIEVRDNEGAERCVISAICAGASRRDLADMLFAAVTDHRYIQVGHPLDFTNKALEALDLVDWDPPLVEQVLTSLMPGYATASRMEESNAWRNPIDLVTMVERAFGELNRGNPKIRRHEENLDKGLVDLLLGDNPQAIVDALVAALNGDVHEVDLAGTVAYAAAVRIARFHISNEFGDWDTALHTFTFANAVHQGLQRLHANADNASGRTDLARGIFDAAMSLYLDRFLNVPSARIPPPASFSPKESGQGERANGKLSDLITLFDRQQQVDAAAEAIAPHVYHDSNTRDVIATLGKLLLREDRDFHTIQSLEAAVRQHSLLHEHKIAAGHVLIAASRYLAAHAPTMRAQGQTFNIAQRLTRGEKLFEE